LQSADVTIGTIFKRHDKLWRQCGCALYRRFARRIGVDGSGPRACVDLGGPRQCLRVDILPDVPQFAISNGNGEDPIVLERLIRSYDFPPSEADDQNPVSLRYEFAGLKE
jgi:hypothetical protein